VGVGAEFGVIFVQKVERTPIHVTGVSTMEITEPREVAAANLVIGQLYLVKSLVPDFDDFVGTYVGFELRSYHTFTNISRRSHEGFARVTKIDNTPVSRYQLSVPVWRLHEVRFIVD